MFQRVVLRTTGSVYITSPFLKERQPSTQSSSFAVEELHLLHLRRHIIHLGTREGENAAGQGNAGQAWAGESGFSNAQHKNARP